jgi:PAS domain S-box-containing protein
MSSPVEANLDSPELTPGLLRRAFPFFIEWDASLRIRSTGPSLGKICNKAIPGARITDLFKLRRPVGSMTPEFFRTSSDLLFLFEIIGSNLVLRGEVATLEKSDSFLMLAAPWISEPDEVERLGLTLTDFAIHDQTMDLLQVVQTQRMVNDDLQRLASTLKTQRARLREKEAEARKLALVAARTDNAVVVTDANGFIEWVNDGFVRLTGWTLDEIIGKTPGSFLQGPDTDPKTTQMMREKLRKGEGFRCDILNYDKGGRKYWISVEVQPILNEAGTLTNFMAMEADVTERILGESRRNVQHEISRILAGGSSLHFASAKILQTICDGLGWSVGCFWKPSAEGDELVFVEAWHDPLLDCAVFLDDSRSRTFRLGEGLPGRVWQSGQSAWVPDVTVDRNFPRSPVALACGLRTALALPLFNNGVFQGMMEFFSPDIEKPDGILLQALDGICNQVGQFIVRKNAGDELLRAKEVAEAANRAKSDFLATMSHEIRTPMNGVVGFAQLLQHSELSEQQHDFVTAISNSAESLLRVINDVLDFSKIESGHMDVEARPFSLETCIEEAIETVSTTASEKHLDLAARITAEVPSSVVGDSLRLRQVLVNLLGNAVKFTPSGEVKLEVSASPMEPGRVLLDFKVTDSGIGIAPNQIDQLFKAFHQEDSSTSRRFGGSGLGLAISKRLVELMGGTISVSSRQAEGSVFSFQISMPVADEPKATVEPIPFPDLLGRRVLVVDTHSFSRQVITELLERWGMDVRSAPSPAYTATLLHDWQPQVLLLDSGCSGPADVNFATALARQGTALFTLCQQGDVIPVRKRFGDAISGNLFKPLKVSPLFNSLIAQAQGRHLRQAETSLAPKLQQAGERPLQLLLAEDNHINRKLALAALGQIGCCADVALDGYEALTATKATRYDVILMDVQMPGMDGLEATRQIRKWEAESGNPPVRIIALTANALADDRDMCIKAGMNDYLSKPIRLEELRAVLRQTSDSGSPSSVLPARAPSPAMIALRQLADEFSREDAISLASDFLTDLDRQLEAVRMAIDLRNSDDANRHAHSLRGTASIFALSGLQSAAESIEQACRDGRLDQAKAAWPALQHAAQEAAIQLRPAITAVASAAILEPMS